MQGQPSVATSWGLRKMGLKTYCGKIITVLLIITNNEITTTILEYSLANNCQLQCNVNNPLCGWILGICQTLNR